MVQRLVLLLVLATAPAATSAQDPVPTGGPDRLVALTFDDLPVSRLPSCTTGAVRQVTDQLLETLARYDAPATGFVNSGADCGGEVLEETLVQWLDAGHDLANHTAHHIDINSTPLPEYFRDIEEGGAVVDSLLRERGRRIRYFRPPLLHMGDTPAKREGLRQYLDRTGYRVGVVTMDNQEWVYNRAYDRALQRGDTVLAERVVAGYLDHLDEVYGFYESLSRDAFGREIPQVLLLHANQINADHLDDVLDRLLHRGYRFVTLDEAVADPAYSSRDEYVGPRGLSWIQRWVRTAGGEVPPEPREAEWVAEVR